MPLTADSIQRMMRGHQHLLADTNRAVAAALEFGGKHAVDYVWQSPTFTPRTGKLQGSTRTKVVRTSGGKVLKIQNTAKHAPAIDGGAKAHWIGPSKKKALRFAVAGGFAFSRGHMHPGNRPFKFLYRAYTSAGRVVDRNLTQRLTAISRRF